MTAYRDKEGQGYLVRSVENRFMGISPLTGDFHDTQGICSAASQVSQCCSQAYQMVFRTICYAFLALMSGAVYPP